MVSAITRCAWCNSVIDTERSSRHVCSSACQMAISRWRSKHQFSAIDTLRVLKLLMDKSAHPNLNFQYEDNNGSNNLCMV